MCQKSIDLTSLNWKCEAKASMPPKKAKQIDGQKYNSKIKGKQSSNPRIPIKLEKQKVEAIFYHCKWLGKCKKFLQFFQRNREHLLFWSFRLKNKNWEIESVIDSINGISIFFLFNFMWNNEFGEETTWKREKFLDQNSPHLLDMYSIVAIAISIHVFLTYLAIAVNFCFYFYSNLLLNFYAFFLGLKCWLLPWQISI